MVNDYTTHVKLQQILDYDEKGWNSILFIDELNRAEQAVNQELMQLILDRRINETIIPDTCVIMAAGNPEHDDNNDYMVSVMNAAMKNRFVKYTLEADVKDWLQWASNTKDSADGTQVAIQPDIIEFIAEMPNMLHDPNSQDDIKPTPRGWELLSKVVREIRNYFPEDQESMIYEAARGVIGQNAASSYLSFIRNKSNPLVTMAEIFKSSNDKFNSEILKRVKGDSATRQFVVVDRCLRYMNENLEDFNYKGKNPKQANELCKRFISVCGVVPKDICMGIQKNIGNNFHSIHDILTGCEAAEDYMNLFFMTHKKLMHAKDM
jgi:hypothetical protein